MLSVFHITIDYSDKIKLIYQHLVNTGLNIGLELTNQTSGMENGANAEALPDVEMNLAVEVSSH